VKTASLTGNLLDSDPETRIVTMPLLWPFHGPRGSACLLSLNLSLNANLLCDKTCRTGLCLALAQAVYPPTT
jgi:hypothetical protein